MKKIILFVLVFLVYATSGEISVKQGWNLIGATNSIKAKDISSAKTVWVFRDNSWSLYEQNSPSENNYGFNTVDEINMGEGFWINSAEDSTVHIKDFVPTETYYTAYNLAFRDRKNDSKYVVSNRFGTNEVSFDSENQIFSLIAYKDIGYDSQARIDFANIWTYSAMSIEAQIIFETSTSSSNKTSNRTELRACGLRLNDETHNTAGCAGLVLREDGAYVWYSTYSIDNSSYKDYLWTQIGTEDMRDKNITMKISIDNSKIIYSLTGDVKHYKVYDTSEAGDNSTVVGYIHSASVVARVRAYNVSDDTLIADYSKVIVKNIGVQFADSK